MSDNRPIGVFDSGIGGLSTTRTMATIMPHESFVFLGDSKNAPYGDQEQPTILNYSRNNVEFLLKKNVKAIVIACNTATSAAKTQLVNEFPEIPIIGIEPALKPAVVQGNQHILVLSTALTMKLPKFQTQYQKYQAHTDILLRPLPGLVDIIETGVIDGPQIDQFAVDNLLSFEDKGVDSIVLGCTHYPFVRNSFAKLFPNVQFYDGFDGVSKRVISLLSQADLLAENTHKQTIDFYSTEDTPTEINRYQSLFDRYQVLPSDLVI